MGEFTKCLAQEKYKDHNGRDVEASLIDALAPYHHVVDGFYSWACGRCGDGYSSRSCGWPISGQVLICDGCKAMNLLVRTSCVEIDEALQGKWRAPEREAELARLRSVVEINDKKVIEIKQRLQSLVQVAVGNWRLSIEDQEVTK